ncbi:MAG: iron-containing alcohol dehydrogenase, partial [Chloroflexota bacterium]
MKGTFQYLNPSIIHWGVGARERLADELERLGLVRPFLVTTRSVARNADLMAAVTRAAGRPLAGMFGEVGQHAPESAVEAALEAATSAAADGIISIGGGSPIDVAKMVALSLAEQRTPTASQPPTALPHLSLPTTLSVAELAPSAGVTDHAGRKGGRRDPRLTPSVAIYDAWLCLPTPMELWLSTGIRALDHAVESFLSAGDHPFSDVLALEAIRRLFASLPEAKAVPTDLETRTENQLAAWFSYTLPLPAMAGLSHTLGKQIGSPYGIPHGITSCLLLPHVLRYLAPTMRERVAVLSSAMGQSTQGVSAEARAEAAASAVYELVASLGLPQHLGDYGLTEEQLR